MPGSCQCSLCFFIGLIWYDWITWRRKKKYVLKSLMTRFKVQQLPRQQQAQMIRLLTAHVDSDGQ